MSYIVFAVECGDRLVLSKPVNSPYEKPSLTPIVLSFIQAPRIARRSASGEFSDEDPCAYDAAELIRSRFIGKPVKFVEDYYNETLQRVGGRVSLQSGEDASQLLLKEGLALLPPKIPQGMDKSLFETYTSCMNDAKKSKKGLFSSDASNKVRKLKNMFPDEQQELLSPYIGKQVLCRVEKVLSTSGIVLSSAEFPNIQVATRLTGVIDKELDGVDLLELGKYYVERFLLNRNVNIRFDGFDKFNNVMVSIVSKKGSFQEELLQKGFVKIHNATLALCEHAEALQKAEEAAKEAHLGTWKSYVAPEEATKKVVAEPQEVLEGLPTTLPDGSAGPRYMGPVLFDGTLVQVVQGDILVVEEADTNKLYRLSLAGVRCSRTITREPEGNAPEIRVTYDDYSWESKEFVRSNYIGKQVRVHVEYARCMPKTNEVRPAATITVPETGANINAALIESGFAHFFLAKTDVCSCVSELKDAEEKAKNEGKGIHGTKRNIPVKVVELNHLGDAKAKHYLNFLQRGMQAGRPPMLNGIVDVVLGPSSFRVFVARDNFQISVKLAGVIAPQAAFGGNPVADAYAEEAKLFAVNLLQQRTVSIQVFMSDRGGNFISAVFLPDGTNVSVALVEAGFATVGNADKLPFAQQLIDAEEVAREAQLNIWNKETGSLPSRAAKLEAERAAANPYRLSRVTDDTAKLLPYTLTEVAEDGVSVYLQENSPEMIETSGKIQNMIEKTVADAPHKPQKGELVVAKYEADKQWCRARVIKVNKADDTADVQFIDFGNLDTVATSNIRAIPSNPNYALVRDTPPYAKLAKLAFVKAFKDGGAAAQMASEAIYDFSTDVLAKAVYKDASHTYYTVTMNENVASLSETLLQKGLCLLDQRTQSVDPKEFKRHEAAKEIARKGHKGIWQYGDVEEDEDL